MAPNQDRNTRWGRGTLALAAAMAVAMLATACAGNRASSGGGESDTALIGLVTPLTGAFAEIGRDSRDGAQLAVDEINAAGGVAGRELRLVVEDDAGKPATGVNAVGRLTQSENVDVLLGPDLSTVVLASLDTAEAAAIPQLVSAISPAVMEEGDEWVFRARPSDATNAAIMVRYAVEELKLQRIALLYGLDAYGQGALPAIDAAAEEHGVTFVTRQGVPSGAKNVTAQVQAARQARADGILWWGLVPESAVLQKATRQLGFDGALLGANALVNQTTIDLAGPAANGSIAATTFAATDTDPAVQEFIDKFQAEYGRVPNDHGPLYYDMVQVIAAAAEQAGSFEPDRLRDALRATTYEAITGTMRFTATGEYASQSAVIVKVEDGRQQVVSRRR